MFTDLGLKTIEEAKEYGLYIYYDEFMGNFNFNKKELNDNMDKIQLWLISHEDYVLLYQYNKESEGRNWWLTNQDML